MKLNNQQIINLLNKYYELIEEEVYCLGHKTQADAEKHPLFLELRAKIQQGFLDQLKHLIEN